MNFEIPKFDASSGLMSNIVPIVLFVVLALAVAYLFKTVVGIRTDLDKVKPSDNSELVNQVTENKETVEKLSNKLDGFIKFVLSQKPPHGDSQMVDKDEIIVS